jgi:hypothetical protein
MLSRGALALLTLVLFTLACSAAEEPGTYVAIKLHGGLEYMGAVQKDDGQTLVLTTTVGERSFRRTDIVSLRKNLTAEEKTAIQGALTAAKEKARAPEEAVVGSASLPVVPGRRAPASTGRDAGPTFGEGIGQQHLSAYERMDRQLSKKISLEFVDTPLEDAMAFMSQLTGLNIILNPKVRDAKPMVTLRVNDMEAATVIRWLTRLSDTHAEVKDEALYITDKPSRQIDDEERQAIQDLAARLRATVDLPPEGQALTDADRMKIALQLWEKEEPKLTDFPGPDVSIGAAQQSANPFGAAPGQ